MMQILTFLLEMEVLSFGEAMQNLVWTIYGRCLGVGAMLTIYTVLPSLSTPLI